MLTYAIWNNKGGTGKTSLTFQAVCRYAELNPDKRVLIIDMCPQANLSEILLGGQEGGGSEQLLSRQGETPRCSIGGYFDSRIPTPYQTPSINGKAFITNPVIYNPEIPNNIDLVCGDPLLELQAIAMNTLANVQVAVTDTWMCIIDWLKDLLDQLDCYDMVFIDTNPSFSMYTQIALAASDRVILPVMADDSSRRAIQNAFSLIYGLNLPSEVYLEYTFATKLKAANKNLPKIHMLLKNRLTQYMGKASAYNAVLTGIDNDLEELLRTYRKHFTFEIAQEGIVDVRDFQTTGVVAFALGCPFSTMPIGPLKISGHKVHVNAKHRAEVLEAINDIVGKL